MIEINMHKKNKKICKKRGGFQGELFITFLAVIRVVFIMAMLKSILERIPKQNMYILVYPNLPGGSTSMCSHAWCYWFIFPVFTIIEGIIEQQFCKYFRKSHKHMLKDKRNIVKSICRSNGKEAIKEKESKKEERRKKSKYWVGLAERQSKKTKKQTKCSKEITFK